MKKLRPLLMPLACFAAAWAITLAVRSQWMPGTVETPNQSPDSISLSPARGPRRISGDKLAEDFGNRPMSEWAALWEQFAAGASSEDLKNLPKIPYPGRGRYGVLGKDLLQTLGQEELASRAGEITARQPASFAALAETDPEAAWQALGSHNWYPVALATLRTLAAKDPEETLRRFQAMPPPGRDPFQNPFDSESHGVIRHSPLGTIFAAWARKDLEAATAAARKLSPLDQLTAANEIGMTWAFQDGPAAIHHALDSPRAGRLDVMLRASFRTHPEETCKLVKETPRLRELMGESPGSEVALPAWADADPDAVIPWLLNFPDEQKLRGLLWSVLHSKPETLARVIRGLAAGGSNTGNPFVKSIYTRNPELGESLAKELGIDLSGSEFESIRIEMDPEDACDRWLDALAENPDPDAALAALGWTRETACAVAARASKSFPDKAAALAKLVPASSLDATNRWRGPNSDIVRYWPELEGSQTNQNSGGDRRPKFPESLFKLDPAAGAAELLKRPLTSDDASRAIELWAPYDPEAARQWLEQIADDEVRTSGKLALAKVLSTRDPAAALTLLSQGDHDRNRSEDVWTTSLTRLMQQGGDWKSWVARLPASVAGNHFWLTHQLEMQAKVLEQLKAL
ncbi:MAG: hypothetical protein ABIS50_21630 [Luteolibacter sp.]|uniref:hypothetical protein n=1 Tax=Luteolibacter sp. TaxID=1962973 RepID=UPI0032663CDB